jgi:hypothetical protein
MRGGSCGRQIRLRTSTTIRLHASMGLRAQKTLDCENTRIIRNLRHCPEWQLLAAEEVLISHEADLARRARPDCGWPGRISIREDQSEQFARVGGTSLSGIWGRTVPILRIG